MRFCFSKRQHLIATNIGAKSYEDWEQNYKETPIDYTITYASHMRKINLEDLSDNILVNRFLTRFGSWLIIAQSGIGKSVLAMQLLYILHSAKVCSVSQRKKIVADRFHVISLLI